MTERVAKNMSLYLFKALDSFFCARARTDSELVIGQPAKFYNLEIIYEDGVFKDKIQEYNIDNYGTDCVPIGNEKLRALERVKYVQLIDGQIFGDYDTSQKVITGYRFNLTRTGKTSVGRIFLVASPLVIKLIDQIDRMLQNKPDINLLKACQILFSLNSPIRYKSDRQKLVKLPMHWLELAMYKWRQVDDNQLEFSDLKATLNIQHMLTPLTWLLILSGYNCVMVEEQLAREYHFPSLILQLS